MKYIGGKCKKIVNLKFVPVHHHQQKQSDFNTLSLQIGAIKRMNQWTVTSWVEYQTHRLEAESE